MPISKSQNDFKLEELVKSDQHTKDITELSVRIKILEERIVTNEYFAKTFSEAAETQTKIRETLSISFIDLIENNSNISTAFALKYIH